MSDLISSLRGRLIVSCQAYPGEPMRDPDTMARVAQAVAEGGAAAIRAQGIADLREIRSRVSLPLIGLWKDGDSGVVITPTLEHARACAEAGSDIVALDATDRPRRDGLSFAETVADLHSFGVLVMADVSSFDEGVAAAAAGADVVGTTLAGYTDYTEKTPGPDLDLVRRLARRLSVPVIAEGRFYQPDQVAQALELGAHAVVVGTAITHPTTITSWFAAATRQ